MRVKDNLINQRRNQRNHHYVNSCLSSDDYSDITISDFQSKKDKNIQRASKLEIIKELASQSQNFTRVETGSRYFKNKKLKIFNIDSTEKLETPSTGNKISI